jgi:lipopolysaccharide/colanic/teichoic acid biosynthesis glycosyltransferase
VKYLRIKAEDIIENRSLAYNKSILYRITKRMFDIAVSVLGILVLFPIILLAYPLIRLELKEPCLEAQHVYGYKGKVFRIFKIKHKPSGRLGRVLKATGLYKLPQLLNVLKGDMSIIGPLPQGGEEFKQSSKWYVLRLSAKPGITGLWQIKKRQNDGFKEMVRFDLKYIRERSLMLETRIILERVALVFKGGRKR